MKIVKKKLVVVQRFIVSLHHQNYINHTPIINNMEKRTFKVGQRISFMHGMNDDIRSEWNITKIDGNDIFVDWDCHWFPIKDDEVRKIRIVS